MSVKTRRQSRLVKNSEIERIQSVPIDFNSYVSASSVRNFLLNDPILDWLKRKYRKRISENSFVSFVMIQGKRFEQQIISEIKSKIDEKDFVTVAEDTFQDITLKNFYKTLEYMKEGKKFIYQGVLILEEGIEVEGKKYPLCGVPDLIVRRDALQELVTQPINDGISENKENGEKRNKNRNIKKGTKQIREKYEYVILDIKFSLLYFGAGGSLLNSGSFPAFKGQLWIYNYILNRVRNTSFFKSYILGRGWKQGVVKQLSPFERLGVIDYEGIDLKYVEKTKRAIKWMYDLKNGKYDGIEAKSLPLFAYPNMKNKQDYPYRTEKEDIARKLGEITLIWNIPFKERERLHRMGIVSVYDKKFGIDLFDIKGETKRNIIKNMISLTKEEGENEREILPRRLKVPERLEKNANCIEFFVDFETVNDTLVISDEKNLFKNGDFLFMIGVGMINEDSEWVFKHFTAKELTRKEEKLVCEGFLNYVKEIACGKSYKLYHWSAAEPRIWGNVIIKHSLHDSASKRWTDLLEIIKEEAITFKNCYSYGLKDVVQSLYNNNFILENWQGNCTSGCDAMTSAYDCYIERNRNERSPTIEKKLTDIIAYNETDCKSVYNVLNFIRNHYNICQDLEPPRKKRKYVRFIMEDSESEPSSEPESENDSESNSESGNDSSDEGVGNDSEFKTTEFENVGIISDYLQEKLPNLRKRKIDEIVNGMNSDLIENYCSRSPVNNRWKVGLKKREVKKYEPLLLQIRDDIEKRKPNIYTILSSELPYENKIKVIQEYDIYRNCDEYTREWQDQIDKINDILKNKNPVTKYKTKIDNLQVSEAIREIIQKKYEDYSNDPNGSSHSNELRKWLIWTVDLPFDRISPLPILENNEDVNNYCVNIMKTLDQNIYGMKKVKERILEVVVSRIINPRNKCGMIALQGSPGVGKTTICKYISEAVGLPYQRINLGGSTDSTIFKGCASSWAGSTPSVILQSLINMKCSNGILVLDEIDKIGFSPKGKEVQSSLLHLTDYSQNSEYSDDFISEFPHDLSRLWFLFTLNDENNVDLTLKDRLEIIRIPEYKKEEKKEILKNYILPKVLKEQELAENDIVLNDDVIEDLVGGGYENESGLRGVEKKIGQIVRKISVLKRSVLCNSKLGELKLSYWEEGKEFCLPICVDRKLFLRLVEPEREIGSFRNMYV